MENLVIAVQMLISSIQSPRCMISTQNKHKIGTAPASIKL